MSSRRGHEIDLLEPAPARTFIVEEMNSGLRQKALAI